VGPDLGSSLFASITILFSKILSKGDIVENAADKI